MKRLHACYKAYAVMKAGAELVPNTDANALVVVSKMPFAVLFAIMF